MLRLRNPRTHTHTRTQCFVDGHILRHVYILIVHTYILVHSTTNRTGSEVKRRLYLHTDTLTQHFASAYARVHVLNAIQYTHAHIRAYALTKIHTHCTCISTAIVCTKYCARDGLVRFMGMHYSQLYTTHINRLVQ